MSFVNFVERIGGAIEGAAVRLLKYRKAVIFDPDDFDVDDVEGTVQGSGDAAGSVSAYTRVRVRAGAGGVSLTGNFPTTIQPDDAAFVGIGFAAARDDHRHAIVTAAPVAVGTANSEGVSTSFARADHVHEGITNVVGVAPIVVTGTTTKTVSINNVSGVTAGAMTIALYNFLTNILTASVPTTIAPDDAADPGASTTFAARADHTHAITTSAAGTINVGDAAAEGAGSAFARNDHVHALPAPGAPQSVGAANSAGSSTKVAREDHVHAFATNRELGANTLTGTTTTRYLTPGYNSGTASSNPLDMAVTKPFKIDSMRMLARVGGTAGQTISATVRKNGAAVGTAILTTASDATSGSSTFTAVSFAAGDTWGLQIDKSGAIATSPTDIFWTIGITP